MMLCSGYIKAYNMLIETVTYSCGNPSELGTYSFASVVIFSRSMYLAYVGNA